MRKRFISFLLAMCMAISTVPGVSLSVSAKPMYSDLVLDINMDHINAVGYQTPYTTSCGCFAVAYCRTMLDNSIHNWWEYNGNGNQNEQGAWTGWSTGGGQYQSDYYSKGQEQALFQRLCNELDRGKPTVLCVTGNGNSNRTTGNQHYIALVGYQNTDSSDTLSLDNFLMIDSSIASQNANGDHNIETVSDHYKLYYSDCYQIVVDMTNKSVSTITKTPYISMCTSYYCYGSATVTKDEAKIWDRPCSDDTDPDAVVIERGTLSCSIIVTAKYINTVGKEWYRVQTESGQIGYIYSGNCEFTSGSDVAVSGLKVPTSFNHGDRFWLEGTISTQHLKLLSVSYTVYDEKGNRRTGGTDDVNGNSYNLYHSAVCDQTEFNTLEPGTYKSVLEVFVEHEDSCLFETLHTSTFTVKSNAPAVVDYTSNPNLNREIAAVVAGDIDVYSNYACTNEVYMPVGQYMSNSTEYFVQSKATGTVLSGWQCFIYANAVYNKLFHEWVGGGEPFTYSYVAITGGVNTVSYEQFANAGIRSGAYIRTTNHANGAYNGNAGHSLIVLSYDSNNITCLEGNADNYGLVAINTRTWADFNAIHLSGRGRYLCHVVQVNADHYNSLYPSASCTHNYIKSEEAASCISDGVITYTCDNCGDVYTEITPALGHDYEAVVTPSTCEGVGYTTYTCSRCNDSYAEENETKWSKWSEEYPENIPENWIERKTQYRYRDQETTTSTENELTGWTLIGPTTIEGGYGDFGEWSDAPIAASDTVKVETRTVWGYYYYLCSNCGKHMYGMPYCFTWANGCGAPTNDYNFNGFWLPVSWDAAGFRDWYGATQYANIDGAVVFKWTDGGIKTQYRSCEKEVLNGYSFWRWADWSDWADTAVEETETRQVETRTVYRHAELGEVAHTPNIPAPTETEDQVCIHCGTVLAVKTGHVCKDNLIWQHEVKPTCIKPGTMAYYACSCGKYYKDAEAKEILENVKIEAVGHKEEVIPGREATCTATGLTDGLRCAVCGEILAAQETLPVLSHVEQVLPASAPTCTATGLTEGKKCSVCGEILTAQEILPALEHTAVILPAVESTCVSAGLTEGKGCSVCGTVLVPQEVLEKLPHTEEMIPALEPSCSAVGYTEGKKCSVCGEILVPQEEVPKLSHEEEILPSVAPTCINPGLTEGMKCSVCGETLLAQEMVPALGHTLQILSGFAPTCTEPGMTEGEQCSVCGTVTKEQNEIPATGHSWSNGVCSVCDVECQHSYPEEGGSCTICGGDCAHAYDTAVTLPTCTAQGYTVYTCSLCGNSYNGDYVEALGHDWKEATCTAPKTCSRCSATEGEANGHTYAATVTAPTCGQQGYTTHTCHCGDSYVDSYVEPLEHTPGTPLEENRKEATCTEPGSYETVVYCSICGEELSRIPGTLPAKGHVGGDVVMENKVAETCIHEGSYEEVVYCIHCSAEMSRTKKAVPANGIHTEATDASKAPTCTAPGLTEGKRCSVCGEILVPQEQIPAQGHTPGEAATCETAQLCTVCEIELAPALGHDLVAEKEIPATCTEPGYHSGASCSRCDYTEGGSEIPALGHSEVIDAAREATCTEEGATEGRHCDRCGEILIPQERIPSLGHSFADGVCTRCGISDKADYQIVSGKSMNLKVLNPETGKAYTAQQIRFSLDETYDAFASLTASGKLTAKKVFELTRIEFQVTVLSTGETLTYTVDIYPALTQLEVQLGEEVLPNNAVIPVDFDSEPITFQVNCYPEDTLENVEWSISDKSGQYAEYSIDGDRLTVSNPDDKAGTVTVKAAVNAGSKKTVTFKLQFASYAKTVRIEAPQTTVSGGDSLKLTASITSPEEVTKPGIVWSVSDKTLATISGGTLKAKNLSYPATVTVTATSRDGQASDSIDIRILPKKQGQLVLMLDGRYVTGKTVSLNAEDVCQLEAYTILDGEIIGEDVTWSSAKPKTAEVDENGLVTALASGTAKITAKSGSMTAYVNLKVTTLASDIEITTKDGKNLIEEDGETMVVLPSGKSTTLSATVQPKGAGKAVTWEIIEGGNAAKLTSSGKLTANKDQTRVTYVQVRATAKDGSGCYGEITAKVLPLANGVQIFESGNRVRSNTVYVSDLENNPVIHLSARVYPFQALQEVEFTSSNKKVAYFDEFGDLICLGTGSTNITATAQDGSKQKATFKLTVVNQVADLSLKEDLPLDAKGDVFIAGGKSLKLATMVDIYPSNATNKKLTWSVSHNDAGIKVNASGVLSTRKVSEPVTVNIMAVTQDGSGEMLSFDVTVYPATTKLTLRGSDRDVTGKVLILEENESIDLTALSKPENAANVYTWQSSNEDFVYVDDSGTVTALQTGKVVTVTCKAADGSGKSATVKIKVS